MSLSSDNIGLTMPVQPANTNNGNGFGFGGDGSWWIIVLFLFIFCGWGGNWGGNRAGAGAGVVDGYILTSDFANIERKIDGVNNGMCDGFYQQAQLINGVQQTVSNGFMSAEMLAKPLDEVFTIDEEPQDVQAEAYDYPVDFFKKLSRASTTIWLPSPARPGTPCRTRPGTS